MKWLIDPVTVQNESFQNNLQNRVVIFLPSLLMLQDEFLSVARALAGPIPFGIDPTLLLKLEVDLVFPSHLRLINRNTTFLGRKVQIN